MLRDLVRKNRSYRRFHQDVTVDIGTLRELVDLARLGASSGNRQPLRYVLSCEPATNAAIFAACGWAGYLTDWGGPAEGERPAAYIVILGDTSISQSFSFDAGIAAQNILLGATEKGLGGCIIGSANKEMVRQALNIPARYEVVTVVALGRPSETVVLETVGPDGNIKYWRDQNGVHHVPKRPLDELILDFSEGRNA